MRIACPGCAAEYEVPSSNLRPHRKVRCTRCSAEWVPVQDAATQLDPLLDGHPDDAASHEPGLHETAPHDMQAQHEEVYPMPPPGETAMDRLAAAARPSGGLRAAWVLTVLVLAGSAAAAMTWRGQVTRAWPASAWILGGADRTTPPPAQPPHAGAKVEKSPD